MYTYMRHTNIRTKRTFFEVRPSGTSGFVAG